MKKTIGNMVAMVTIVALFATACGTTANQEGNANRKTDQMAEGITGRTQIMDRNGQSPFPPGSVRPLQNTDGFGGDPNGPSVLIPFTMLSGKKYIAVDELAKVLEFENVTFDQRSGVQQIGDRDVLFRLKLGSRQAEKAGRPFTLSEAPKLANGRMILSATAAADLFKEDMVFDVGSDGILLYPSDTQVNQHDSDAPDPKQVDESLDFGDDPNDPAADKAVMTDDAVSQMLESISDDPQAIPTLKNIDMNALVETARRYLGVKYQFGAAPYPESNRFDCSSYTKYVFGKYGVVLPRLAREQARIGNTVSRQSLRIGDLLFFYVPGRFKSNNVVGHVGIYIGNRQMIHAGTEPKNGVQIRSIDRDYWKRTFLSAKRVAY
jgi:cell wall-associated NlpC family hydrolase